MPQIVMCDAIRTDLLAGPIKRLLAFSDPKYFHVQWFVFSLAQHPFKQRPSIGNQRDTAQLPILCAGGGVPTHNNLARVKVHISPRDLAGLTNTAAGECQPRREIGTVE